jgi:dTDP-4-dehydrorhamnose reductase
MRILITGHKGQLGRELWRALAGETLLGADLPELDITNASAISQAIVDFRPDVVLHPAAYTDTAGCERDHDLAYRVNALGTRNVALACQRVDAVLLYISTNEVFDGQKTEPYLEWEQPNPLNVYARSKLAGEWYVQMLLECFYIVRVAWLYSRAAASFVTKILQAASEQPELCVVTDEVATPTYAPDLAVAIATLIRQPIYGIYHFTNAGRCSRYEWALKILELAGRQVPVRPVTMSEFPGATVKPLYSVLRNFCGAALGITLRPWEEALAEAMGKSTNQQITNS